MQQRVVRREFVPDPKKHTDDPDPRTGTVVITYLNGRVDEFDGIARVDFFRWKASGWRDRAIPHGVRVQEPIETDPQMDEGEEIEETPDDGIPEDDYLGQATGFPTNRDFTPEERELIERLKRGH